MVVKVLCSFKTTMVTNEFYYLHFIIVGVTAMDQYVYAVGGYDATYQLPSVERYCVETNQWEMLCKMNRPRSALGVAVVNSKLYAIGECHHFVCASWITCSIGC